MIPTGVGSKVHGIPQSAGIRILSEISTIGFLRFSVRFSSSAAWREICGCQRCHMLHDRPHHLAQRWITYRRRLAAGDLFLGPYPAMIAALTSKRTSQGWSSSGPGIDELVAGGRGSADTFGAGCR